MIPEKKKVISVRRHRIMGVLASPVPKTRAMTWKICHLLAIMAAKKRTINVPPNVKCVTAVMTAARLATGRHLASAAKQRLIRNRTNVNILAIAVRKRPAAAVACILLPRSAQTVMSVLRQRAEVIPAGRVAKSKVVPRLVCRIMTILRKNVPKTPLPDAGVAAAAEPVWMADIITGAIVLKQTPILVVLMLNRRITFYSAKNACPNNPRHL